MVEPSLPRGVRDFNTAEAIVRREVLAVVEETFKRFGFSPIETPALENLNVLYAKTYGEESGKEIFKIEGEDAALRYDFTVPLARFIAMNKDTPLPFKRYQIGSIWRKDEPQRMPIQRISAGRYSYCWKQRTNIRCRGGCCRRTDTR